MKILPRMYPDPETNSIAGLVKSIGPALSFESRTDHGDQPAKLLTRDEARGGLRPKVAKRPEPL